MARRLLVRLALGTSLLAAALPALADSAVKEASTRQTEDALTAATARLEAAVDRAEDAEMATMADRSQRADLLGRAKDLKTEAGATLRTGASRESLVAGIDAVAAGLIALADASVEAAAADAGKPAQAPFGEATDAGAGLTNPHSATTVLRFRDVSEDVLSVLPGLSETEAADARQLIQSGDDVVVLVKDGRRSDHQARTAHLRSLEEITSKLQALYQTGLLDRKKGQPFVASWHAPDGWVPVSAEAAGLKALRVSFVKPGTAWVMLQNLGTEPREYFAEIEFYDHVGESTGMASVKSEARGELKPGEVRRVLVPIIPTDARFWDVTTGFSIYVE